VHATRTTDSAGIAPSEELLDFFRREFQAEQNSGFARISRVPDSYVMANLRYYRSLGEADRAAFIDCCAHWAHANYGFVIGAPRFDHTLHPFFSRWHRPNDTNDWDLTHKRNVPLLRSMVSQYKMDMHRGVPSCITKAEFKYASSIRSVKAPELRKRVLAALKPLGYYKKDQLGYYCRHGGREFRVSIDCGSRCAQLHYVVSRPDFPADHLPSRFAFERVLGFGHGDWDFIVEENVDDVFSLFPDLVVYSYQLPDRIRAEVPDLRRKGRRRAHLKPKKRSTP
jgi:hypothetical protein